MKQNLGHITRGDPVYRTRKMLEKEIAELEEEIRFRKNIGDLIDNEELELERAKDMLDSLNSCFV